MRFESRWRSGVVALGLLGSCLVCVSSCLRAGKSRAERDMEVGQAERSGLSVRVNQGHAAIVALEPDIVELWGGVPSFELSLQTDASAAQTLTVAVGNLMPRAELRLAPNAAGQVGAPERVSETRARWQVTVPPGAQLRLELGPPDSASDEGFQFALLSDVQEAIDGFHDMIERLNQEADVRFVIGAGDLTSRGTREELARFKRELAALAVPYFATLGNHELGQEPPPYHDMFGRGNYSFEFHGVRFTLLDSASATLDPIVYDWLAEWLARGRAQTHVVAMHIPPMDPSGTRHGSFASKNEAAKLLNQLALANVDLTLYGHIHTYLHFDNAGIDAHIAGGGGAIPNRGDGIGRHYLLVRVHPTRGVEETRLVQVDSDWDF